MTIDDHLSELQRWVRERIACGERKRLSDVSGISMSGLWRASGDDWNPRAETIRALDRVRSKWERITQ